MNNDKSLTEKLSDPWEIKLRDKSIENLGFKKGSSEYNLIIVMIDNFFLSGMLAAIKLIKSGEIETIHTLMKDAQKEMRERIKE